MFSSTCIIGNDSVTNNIQLNLIVFDGTMHKLGLPAKSYAAIAERSDKHGFDSIRSLAMITAKERSIELLQSVVCRHQKRSQEYDQIHEFDRI